MADSHQSTEGKKLTEAGKVSTISDSSQAFVQQEQIFIMSAYLHYNDEYKVLICKTHQYALSRKSLTRHFLEEHSLNLSIRQSINNYAEQFMVTKAMDLTYCSEAIYSILYAKHMLSSTYVL